MYKFFRPLVFLLSPETAHNAAILLLKNNLVPAKAKEYNNLQQNVFGLDFKNPIGMAAGFDKNAECINNLEKIGFGFVEVGTVTPKAQSGNPKPRIFRVKEHQAIINRLGFNNKGMECFSKNLDFTNILGVNIGKNKLSEDAGEDYKILFSEFHDRSSYITINISSPNTPGLRKLQNKKELDILLSEINELRKNLKSKTPILVKIAPDLSQSEIAEIAQILENNNIDGVIISNTTLQRPFGGSFEGGLSGRPVFELSNKAIENFYDVQKDIPIIGVGGISSYQDVIYKMKLGASLVQIYSALIYQGFGLVEQIKKELSNYLEKNNIDNISKLRS